MWYAGLSTTVWPTRQLEGVKKVEKFPPKKAALPTFYGSAVCGQGHEAAPGEHANVNTGIGIEAVPSPAAGSRLLKCAITIFIIGQAVYLFGPDNFFKPYIITVMNLALLSTSALLWRINRNTLMQQGYPSATQKADINSDFDYPPGWWILPFSALGLLVYLCIGIALFRYF